MKLRKSLSVLLSFILIFSVFAVPTAFAGEAFDNIDDAGRYLRAELVKREPVIEFDYLVKTADISDGNYFNDLFDTIEAEATHHTGVPDEGDYINNHYDVMNPALSAEIAGSECSVHFTFNMTYRADAERERATTEKLREVLAELALDGKNDYEKVVAVHDYILDHVTYDHEHVNDENYLPQYTACAALLDGTAVCQGYATLMYRMLLEVGVDCRVVTGYVDGEGHAWNIVKLGDLYYNIDATFDDGEGMDPRECFLKNAAHFADHERDPEFLTEAFLNAYPISPEDYSGDGSELVEKPTLLLDAPESCKPDDVISVRAILKNDAKFQSTSMMLKWDPEVLEFLSQGSDISDAFVEGGKLSDETARIDLIFSNIQNVSELTLATFTFKVLRGDTDTTLSLNVIDGDYDGVMEPDAADVSIHVEAEETEAPVTEPPITVPPVTEPPITEPPVTEPPITEPPETEPPITFPLNEETTETEPPITEVPETEPPITEAPITEPPTTGAPITEAPSPVNEAILVIDAPEKAEKGDYITVNVSISNALDFLRGSFTLEWNSEILEYVSQEQENPDNETAGGRLDENKAFVALFCEEPATGEAFPLGSFTFRVIGESGSTAEFRFYVKDNDISGVAVSSQATASIVIGEPVAEPTQPPVDPVQTELYYGDADLDGKVKAGDARMILRHAAKIELLTDETALAVSDLDLNGKVNAADARLALRVASRQEEKKPFDPSAKPLPAPTAEPEPITEPEPTAEPEPTTEPVNEEKINRAAVGGTVVCWIEHDKLSDPAFDFDHDHFQVIYGRGSETGDHFAAITPLTDFGQDSVTIIDKNDPDATFSVTVRIDPDFETYAQSKNIPDPGVMYGSAPTLFLPDEQPDGFLIYSFAYALDRDGFAGHDANSIIRSFISAAEARGFAYDGSAADDYGIVYDYYVNDEGEFFDFAVIEHEDYGVMLLVEF